MIGYPPGSPHDDQLELGLIKPLAEMDVGLGGAAHRFYVWVEEWVRSTIAREGCVWTDDLHLAAAVARSQPPDDSLYGRFWSSRARRLGLRRTVEERTSRARSRNGAKARKWVPEERGAAALPEASPRA